MAPTGSCPPPSLRVRVAWRRTAAHTVTRLEDLTRGALIQGVLADRAVRVVDVAWHGSNAITLTYTDEPTGKVDQELLYRDAEPRLSVEQAGRAWSMDADGGLFRLVSEARRISLAYLFDPFLAVQTSNLDPLPHQIDAVYDKMLPRQPPCSGVAEVSPSRASASITVARTVHGRSDRDGRSRCLTSAKSLSSTKSPGTTCELRTPEVVRC